MSHVGQWMNREAFRVTDRASEKPPLWQDLRPGVKERHPDDTDAQCVELQRRVLVFAQQHFADFTHVTVESLLDIFPDHAVESYVERFKHAVWQDLLKLVYDFCGPSFQHDALSRFNRDSPSTLCGQSSSTIAQGMCQVLENIPEVVQNPALRTKEAAQDLLREIEPIILRWAVRQCEGLVRGGGESKEGQILSVVEEQLVRYQSLLARYEASLKDILSNDVAAREERSPRRESPPPAMDPKAMDIDNTNLPPSSAGVSSKRIQPRLVPSSQKSSMRTKRRRDSIDSSQRGPSSCSSQLQNRQPIQPGHPDIYRQLDDMLELPSQPRKLKRGHDGRGWRTRPAVHANPETSL